MTDSHFRKLNLQIQMSIILPPQKNKLTNSNIVNSDFRNIKIGLGGERFSSIAKYIDKQGNQENQ